MNNAQQANVPQTSGYAAPAALSQVYAGAAMQGNAGSQLANKSRLEQIDERLAIISQQLGGMHEHALGQRNRLRGPVPERDNSNKCDAPKSSGMLGQIEDRLSWIENMIGQINMVHHDIASVL